MARSGEFAATVRTEVSTARQQLQAFDAHPVARRVSNVLQEIDRRFHSGARPVPVSITHERRGPVDAVVSNRDVTRNGNVSVRFVGLRWALVDVLDERVVVLETALVTTDLGLRPPRTEPNHTVVPVILINLPANRNSG